MTNEPPATNEAGRSNSGRSNSGRSNSGRSNSGRSNSGRFDAVRSDLGGSDSGRSEAGRSLKPRLARVGRTAAAVAACVVAYLLGQPLGPALREAAMVSTETSPLASVVSFDDASELAAAFLAGRDTTTVAAPWDMTARDVLGLYHLENNQSARAALLEQLGVADLDAILPRGSSFSFVLSPERLEP